MEEEKGAEEGHEPSGSFGGGIMLKEYFIKQGIKEAQIEEFIRKEFPLGDYSRTELQRTPLGIKIIIYTNKPGRIIGKSGKNINEMTEAVKQRFGLDNPQLDVKLIRNPNLDPRIVAKQIASALEKGYNYKKIGNLTMKRVMDSGAIGAQIIISGKLGGGKGITGKFQEGYLKHCGEPARTLVDYGFEEAQTRPGKIGIKVKIMREFQDITGHIRKEVEHRVDISEAPEEEAREEKPSKPEPAKKKPEKKPRKAREEKTPEKRARKEKEAPKKKSREARKKPAKPREGAKKAAPRKKPAKPKPARKAK
jgi:small subunit ribosomal protein S3